MLVCQGCQLFNSILAEVFEDVNMSLEKADVRSNL